MKKEIIIKAIGPSLFEMNGFIDECANDCTFVIAKSKFVVGQVVDRIASVPSALDSYV